MRGRRELSIRRREGFLILRMPSATDSPGPKEPETGLTDM